MFSPQEADAIRPEFPGSQNERYGEGSDLHGDIDPHRELNEADRKYVLTLSALVVDKRFDWVVRASSAQYLGEFGHSLAIPALLAVIRDDNDHLKVRQKAVYGLSLIRDKRVVGYLIEDALGSAEENLVMEALENLPQLTGSTPEAIRTKEWIYGVTPPPGYQKDQPTDPKELEAYLDVWRKWWREKRDEVRLDVKYRGKF